MSSGMTPPIIITNDFQHAQQLNSFFQSARSMAYNSVAQSIANSTATALSFNTNKFDIGGNKKFIHSTTTNLTRFTAPFKGLYEALGQCYITGLFTFEIRVNGASLTPQLVSQQPQVVGFLQLNPNDYVEFFIVQNSGASQNTVPTQTFGSLVSISKI